MALKPGRHSKRPFNWPWAVLKMKRVKFGGRKLSVVSLLSLLSIETSGLGYSCLNCSADCGFKHCLNQGIIKEPREARLCLLLFLLRSFRQINLLHDAVSDIRDVDICCCVVLLVAKAYAATSENNADSEFVQ